MKAIINQLTSGDEYIIRVDDNEVNGAMNLESRFSDTDKVKLSYGPAYTEHMHGQI